MKPSPATVAKRKRATKARRVNALRRKREARLVSVKRRRLERIKINGRWVTGFGIALHLSGDIKP